VWGDFKSDGSTRPQGGTDIGHAKSIRVRFSNKVDPWPSQKNEPAGKKVWIKGGFGLHN